MNQPISIGRYGLAYLLWAITVALTIVALLVWRNTEFIALGMTSWDRYIEHAINQFGFLFLAIASLSVMIFAEYFYRTGVEKRCLLRRFFLLTTLQVFFIALAHGVQWVGGLVLKLPTTPIVFFSELVACVVLFILYRRSGKGVTFPGL